MSASVGQDPPHFLDGKRVLLIEDEYYIADEVRRILEDLGAEIVGPVASVQTANAALDEGAFDCAVLDLNLHGESAIPVAERLAAEGRSFAIATGYGSPAVPEGLRNVPRIEKPFDPQALIELLAQLSCART
ncbi:MAG: response regulator [Sphingomonas sp.]|nr:response regulator [Sphingomonas sp.]